VNPGTSTDGDVNDYSLAESGTGYTLDDDNITIEKGVQSVDVIVNVYEDLSFEVSNTLYNKDTDSYEETAIFTLKSVVSGPVELDLTAQPAYTLTIYEDDTYVELDWDVSGAGPNDDFDPGDVNLDMFLTLEDEIMNYSVTSGTDYEAFFIPAGFADGTYGMRYPFVSGTTEVDIYAVFINLGGTVDGTEQGGTYHAHYTLDNINNYRAPNADDEGHENYKGDPQVVQSITKSKLNYPTITEITVPTAGSRVNEAPVVTTQNRLSKGAYLHSKGMSSNLNMFHALKKSTSFKH
jgi:hypothetical protein